MPHLYKIVISIFYLVCSCCFIYGQQLEDPSIKQPSLEQLGDLAYQKKEWQQASDYFKKALETDPTNAQFHYKYAGALATHARYHKFKALFVLDDAMEHFLIAEKLAPESIAIKMALVEMYDKLPRFLGGDAKKAAAYVQKISLLDRDSGKKALEIINSPSL